MFESCRVRHTKKPAYAGFFISLTSDQVSLITLIFDHLSITEKLNPVRDVVLPSARVLFPVLVGNLALPD